MTDVAISLVAKEQLERLDPSVQERIKNKLLGAVADDPDRHLESLSNSPHSRVRVGDYRVIVEWDRGADVLKIHDVGSSSKHIRLSGGEAAFPIDFEFRNSPSSLAPFRRPYYDEQTPSGNDV